MLLFIVREIRDIWTVEERWAETPHELIGKKVWKGKFIVCKLQTPEHSEAVLTIVTVNESISHSDVEGHLMGIQDKEWAHGRGWVLREISGGGHIKIDQRSQAIQLGGRSLDFGEFDQEIVRQLLESWQTEHPEYKEYKVEIA